MNKCKKIILIIIIIIIIIYYICNKSYTYNELITFNKEEEIKYLKNKLKFLDKQQHYYITNTKLDQIEINKNIEILNIIKSHYLSDLQKLI